MVQSSTPDVLRGVAPLAERLATSADARAGVAMPNPLFRSWFAAHRAADHSVVERIPFADLERWSFAAGTGNLHHDSGRFFSVEGVEVLGAPEPYPQWSQPIINQPEVGILGVLAREIDGVLHFLMQAKMEPGNPGLVQLSPTVQATLSNYQQVHRGARVEHLEHFVGPARGDVLVDLLQPEHGAWFLGKANRNMVVEVQAPVDVGDNFCWLTLGQLGDLLQTDNLVNMDARTVLSCLPVTTLPWCAADGFRLAVARSLGGDRALHPTGVVTSWLTDARTDGKVRTGRLPLRDVAGWRSTETAISRPDGRFFEVIAVRVQTSAREVNQWTQPLFAPYGQGVVAFLVSAFAGVLHVLIRARVEAGLRDAVALGPTVQCVPSNHDVAPRFLDHVLGAGPDRVRYDAVHSEEGGRFFRAESRYLVVDAGDDVAAAEPDGYRWVTLAQLNGLLQHEGIVNVQARTLIACLKLL